MLVGFLFDHTVTSSFRGGVGCGAPSGDGGSAPAWRCWRPADFLLLEGRRQGPSADREVAVQIRRTGHFPPLQGQTALKESPRADHRSARLHRAAGRGGRTRWFRIRSSTTSGLSTQPLADAVEVSLLRTVELLSWPSSCSRAGARRSTSSSSVRTTRSSGDARSKISRGLRGRATSDDGRRARGAGALGPRPTAATTGRSSTRRAAAWETSRTRWRRRWRTERPRRAVGRRDRPQAPRVVETAGRRDDPVRVADLDAAAGRPARPRRRAPGAGALRGPEILNVRVGFRGEMRVHTSGSTYRTPTSLPSDRLPRQRQPVTRPPGCASISVEYTHPRDDPLSPDRRIATVHSSTSRTWASSMSRRPLRSRSISSRPAYVVHRSPGRPRVRGDPGAARRRGVLCRRLGHLGLLLDRGVVRLGLARRNDGPGGRPCLA